MKKILIALMLFAIAGFSGIADAKLIKIGTATISDAARGSQGGGPLGSAAVAPVSNEFNLIYEDDQGLIWLDYSSGNKEWPQSVAWAAGLNEAGALIIKLDPGISVSWSGDWRLPKTVDGARKNGYDGSTTAGFNITSSEMGHLFYVSLGNKGLNDTKGNEDAGFAGLKNKEPFKNLQDGIYWSGTQYAIYTNHAWHFNFYYGAQDFISFTNSYSYPGMAVRPGKVVSQ